VRPLIIRRPGDSLTYVALKPSEANRSTLFTKGVGRVEVPLDFSGDCGFFARDHAVLLLRVGPEIEVVDLPGLIRVRLRAWAHLDADHLSIRDQVANVNVIFNGLNPAGVVFDLQDITPLPPEAWEAIGHNCLRENEIRRSAHFEPGSLNVYYHAVPDVAARCCSAGDMIFLGPGSPLGRLAHEAGHALGIRGESDGSGSRYEDGHADSLQTPNPFTDANILWRGNAMLRWRLTLGQIAWMHASERSILKGRGGRRPFLYWTDDHPDRRPQHETRDRASALAVRYERMLAYWDDGRRPEGRPGSASAAEFIRRQSRP
jgi:hypothetical protein